MCNYQTARQGYGYGYGAGCGGWRGRYGGMGRAFKSVPVNIEEKNDQYELTLFAPALHKESISVSVKDDVLFITYQAPPSSDAENFTRREYRHDSFERSFVLNGKVETTGINATYRDGMLVVILPKNPERNKPAQDVSVQ